MIIYDAATFQIMDSNSSALDIYGYTKTEFQKIKLRELIFHDASSEFNQLHKLIGSSRNYHRKKDGTKLLVEEKKSGVIINSKPAVLLTIIPVTPESTEDTMQALFSAMVETSDDAIIGKRLDGKIISWNKGAEIIYGYTADEIVGKNITTIAPPGKIDEINDIMKKLRRGEKIEHYETERITKDGKIITVSVAISPVKDSKGNIIGASSIARDISHIKKNIAQLKENEIIFRHLIENLSEVFYVSNPCKTEIIYMSEAYEKVFGQPVETIYSNPLSYLNFIIKKDRNKAYRAIARQKKGIPTDSTYRIKWNDGTIKYLRERAFPVKDETGNVSRIIGIAEDITERINSEGVLKKSESRYRSIFESAAVSMIEFDFSGVTEIISELKTGGVTNFRKYFYENIGFVEKCIESIKIIDVNPNAVKLFKAKNREELLNRFQIIRPAAFPAVFTEQLIVLASGGNHFEAEYELRNLIGETIYVYGVVSFPEENAPYQYTVSSLIDITERKLAERALSESEKRFRVMADTAPVLIWTTGADKGFYYFNKPWLVFRGSSIESELGRQWINGIHPADLPLFIKAFNSAFAAKKEFKIEFRLKRSDGEYRWLLNHGVPRYTEDGIFQGFVGSSIDITEMKQNEVALSKSLTREQNALSRAKASRNKLEFLAEASIILNSSLNYSETIQSLAKLLTPAICDWFILDLIVEGKLKRLVVYHKDVAKIQFAVDLQKKNPPEMNGDGGVPNVIRTGKAELYKELTPELMQKQAKDSELFEIYKELGLRSVMVVPLRIREKVLGAITLCTAETKKNYDEDDLKFAEDIAHRAALAIDNANLFRKIEELNKDLEITIKEQQQEIKFRKKIEKDLREADERFRLITENSNDFITLFDEYDNFLYVNPAFTNVLGYNEDDIVGKISPYDIIHPDDVNSFKNSGVQSVNELRYQRSDGEFVWVESSSLKVNYLGKKITIGISRDITERKKIENERIKLYAQLETQRIRIDNLIANVPGVVWEAWGEPDAEDQKIDFISDYVEKLLGYPVEQWLNTPNFWLKVVHPDDREKAAEGAKYTFRKKTSGINRFRWVAKDGSVLWIEAHSTGIYDREGKVIGMRGVNMDITEQIKYEQQISASLEEKEILLKEIHHRVKNNMQVISSLLSLQSKNIPDKHTQDLFNESRNRIRSMALIHEKLYQSKDLYKIDFRSYVVDLLNNLMISYGIRGKNIRQEIDIENISFDIDTAITLGLIINELVSNSFKHAFNKIKNGTLIVSIHKEGKKFILIVKDDGQGIPEDFNLKNSETLGLQLVDTLIEQFYGKYQIKNNNGTEFIIEFPESADNNLE